MRTSLKKKVKVALESDNTIAVPMSKLNETKGHDLSYFGFLGLSKMDLKRLEREGHALRGYIKKPKGNIYRGHETAVMWTLLDTVLGAL